MSGAMGMPVIAGWAAHFMMGTVLAIVYTLIFSSRLPGTPWVRGAIFSLLPWIAKEIMVSPMMGTGIFESVAPDALLLVMGGLFGHLAYGVVLGAIYGSDVTIPVQQLAHTR